MTFWKPLCPPNYEFLELIDNFTARISPSSRRIVMIWGYVLLDSVLFQITYNYYGFTILSVREHFPSLHFPFLYHC